MRKKDDFMKTVSIDIKKLFESGAHFGHKTSRWHPKMAQYIHSAKNGNHIIDLTKTVDSLEVALGFIEKIVSEGKQILLVGTKKQAHDIVKEVGVKHNMPYVVERWLGGMLTNSATIGERIKYLKDLESRMASGQLAAKYSKLEVQRYQEEIDSMNHLYGGIKDLIGKPGAVFVVDVADELNAIKEARKLDIPVIALVDTNADPSLVTYPIPCNDDSIQTIKLVVGYIDEAIEIGKVAKDKKFATEKIKAE
ncbi:MAG TPA: 30S ribosomal protein S2 [Candidatus Saccharimonadia bacterium]|nr:30S ribosomal protein S2 [Candidatus Saccharimonadia bacterium]